MAQSRESALSRCPAEIWLNILHRVSDLYKWRDPKYSYEDPWIYSQNGLQEHRVTEQMVDQQYSAWLATMTSICCVCSTWHAEMSAARDEWVLFRSRANLIKWRRTHIPTVDALLIKRLDIHFPEGYGNEDVAPFLLLCRELEAVYIAYSQFLPHDVFAPVMEALTEACPETIQSAALCHTPGKRGTVDLLCGLLNLEALAINPFDDVEGWNELFDNIAHGYVGASLSSLQLQLPGGLRRMPSFLIPLSVPDVLPALCDLTISCIPLPNQPFWYLDAPEELLRLFFVAHGSKLTSLHFNLPDHGIMARTMFRNLEYCPNLTELALPACKMLVDEPLPPLARLSRLAVLNTLFEDEWPSYTFWDHRLYVLGLVKQVVAGITTHFPSIATICCADVVPDANIIMPVHEMKLGRQLLEVCAGHASVQLEDALGGSLEPQHMGRRWRRQPPWRLPSTN